VTDIHAAHDLRQDRLERADRCGVCNAAPAMRVVLQGFIGLVLFLHVKSYKGLICRRCGIAMGRDLNARSMLYGWWSIMGPIAVPIAVLANTIRMRALRRLDEPHGAAVGASIPLTIGRPAWQRLGPLIVTAFMAPLSALLLVLVGAAILR
jgi:hypothetical protein